MAKLKTVTDRTYEAQVLNSPVPTFVFFMSPRVAAARALLPVLERMAGEKRHLRFVRFDTEGNHAWPEQLGITQVPALVLFRSATEVARLDAPISGDKLSEEVERMLRRRLVSARLRRLLRRG